MKATLKNTRTCLQMIEGDINISKPVEEATCPGEKTAHHLHEDLGLVFLYFPQWHVAPRRFAMKTCVEKRTKHPERDAAIPLRRPQTPLPRLRKTPASPSAGQSSERSSSTPAGPAEGWLGWDF